MDLQWLGIIDSKTKTDVFLSRSSLKI
jgi:hypothetical protein